MHIYDQFGTAELRHKESRNQVRNVVSECDGDVGTRAAKANPQISEYPQSGAAEVSKAASCFETRNNWSSIQQSVLRVRVLYNNKTNVWIGQPLLQALERVYVSANRWEGCGKRDQQNVECWFLDRSHLQPLGFGNDT